MRCDGQDDGHEPDDGYGESDPMVNSCEALIEGLIMHLFAM